MSIHGLPPESTTPLQDHLGAGPAPAPAVTPGHPYSAPTGAGASVTTAPGSASEQPPPARVRSYPILLGLLAILVALGSTLHVLTGWAWPLDGNATTLGVGVLLVIVGAMGLRRR